MLSIAIDPVADLKRRLARGHRLRTAIAAWWIDHEFALHPASVTKRIALVLIAQRSLAAKRAGIAVLSEQLRETLRASDLPAFARVMVDGHIDDELVELFASRVLAALLAREVGRGAVVRAIFDWRNTDDRRRRAACLALAHVVGEHAPLCLELAQTVVWSIDPGDQRAVGELVHRLAQHAPAHTERFIRRYCRFMSRACIKRCIASYDTPVARELVETWRCATRLRR